MTWAALTSHHPCAYRKHMFPEQLSPPRTACVDMAVAIRRCGGHISLQVCGDLIRLCMPCTARCASWTAASAAAMAAHRRQPTALRGSCMLSKAMTTGAAAVCCLRKRSTKGLTGLDKEELYTELDSAAPRAGAKRAHCHHLSISQCHAQSAGARFLPSMQKMP